MNEHEQLISALVIETTASYPLPKRAKYLHALAALCSDDKIAADLAQIAQDCDAIDRRVGQLALNFGKGGPAT